MIRRITGHVSYANVMATTAMFIALGGSGYAATRLSSPGSAHAAKTHAKQKKAVGDKSADTKLFRKLLAKAAPQLSVAAATRASNATHAGTAGDANTVDGKQVRQFFMKGGANTPSVTRLSVDGIAIKAGCDGSFIPIATVENDSGVAAAIQGAVTSTSVQIVSTDLNPNGGKSVDLTQGTTSGSGYFTVERSDGVVVSVTYGFDEATNFDGENVCTVAGSASAS